MFCELDTAVLQCRGASAKEREIIPPTYIILELQCGEMSLGLIL